MIISHLLCEYVLLLNTNVFKLISNLFQALGYRGSSVVKVLCYKSEGRWLDPSWSYWNFH